jgi:hypothetical protein
LGRESKPIEGENMKATLKVSLKPFQVPNFVLLELGAKPRQEGFDPNGSRVPLSDLEPEDLDRLCEEFRNTVFNKAGKKQPPTVAPVCARCGKSF